MRSEGDDVDCGNGRGEEFQDVRFVQNTDCWLDPNAHDFYFFLQYEIRR